MPGFRRNRKHRMPLQGDASFGTGSWLSIPCRRSEKGGGRSVSVRGRSALGVLRCKLALAYDA